MIIKTVQTDTITLASHRLHDVLDKALPKIEDKSVIVVTSKIVSLCEGRVVKVGEADKDELIKQESDQYIPTSMSPLGVTLTVTRNLLVPSAGIDESNGNGYYILWPKDPQASAVSLRSYLAKKHGLTHLGVLITDSRTTPMRWGTTGIALSYSGFAGINDFIGKPDLFGRKMEMTMVNVADGLAAAAVLAMGETNEQTPLAIISDAPFIHFDAHKPTPKELETWQIPMNIDLYGPLLSRGPWQKGGKNNRH
ncbi:coenzyme F420-0:L-glutamate ligase [Patescibacteria group bacterium]|nr:coenzyme F420-0:L-glutamate ligase [Patescibacteria group bacterium]